MEKSDVAHFILGTVIILILFYLISDYKNLNFFWSRGYYYIVYIAMMLGIIFIVFRRTELLKKTIPYLKYPAFFIFLPFALFPITRCYFRIPYIFCKACPRKCPWGEIRSFIVPAFLLQNFDNRFWCFRLCPFGTIQDYQCKISSKRVHLPKWLKLVRYFLLLLTIAVVLMLVFNIGNIGLENGFLFVGSYELVVVTIIVAIIIFILAFFIPRFWCNYFCPIGSLSDIVLKVEGKFLYKQGIVIKK